MKNCIRTIVAAGMITCLLLAGCSKSGTNYYPDAENDSLAIFSNTGNNLLTCLVDNRTWRSDDRRIPIVSPPRARYELQIHKQVSTGAKDTLYFTWTGYFNSDRNTFGNLVLVLPVEKNFSARDLATLKGQRFHLNTTNGYFTFTSNFTGAGLTKGVGNIYFHTAAFDSVSPNFYSGHISGLFNADFISNKITKGRFDHALSSEHVSF